MKKTTDGLCGCGCGGKTFVPLRNDASKGWVAGVPRPYTRGHHAAKRRFLSCQGYVVLCRPGDPDAFNSSGHVFEHMVVVRERTGVSPQGRPIHHVDENKTNNVPGNLVLCEDVAYHLLLHQRKRAWETCGHAGYRKCVRCGYYGNPADMRLHGKKTGAGYVHQRCRDVHNEMRYAKKA